MLRKAGLAGRFGLYWYGLLNRTDLHGAYPGVLFPDRRGAAAERQER